MGVLGMLPFVAFITMFLLIPTGEIIVGAFRTVNGAFTLSNIDDIFHAPYPRRSSSRSSFRRSAHS